MDLSYLRFFQVLAEELHMTRAAKKLGLSQPALSTAMKKLEEEVGERLFERRGRALQLNDCGVLFLRHCVNILEEYDCARLELVQRRRTQDGILSVAVTGMNYPSNILLAFKIAHPEISIRQSVIFRGDLDRAFAQRDYDMILSNLPAKVSGVRSRIIWEEQFFLAVPPSHTLAACPYVDIEELKGERFVTLPTNYYDRELLENVCREAGFTPAVSMECYQSELPRAVQDGIGVALLPESQLRADDSQSNIRILPLRNNECKWRIYLLEKEDGEHKSAAARDYLDYLEHL